MKKIYVVVYHYSFNSQNHCEYRNILIDQDQTKLWFKSKDEDLTYRLMINQCKYIYKEFGYVEVYGELNTNTYCYVDNKVVSGNYNIINVFDIKNANYDYIEY